MSKSSKQKLKTQKIQKINKYLEKGKRQQLLSTQQRSQEVECKNIFKSLTQKKVKELFQKSIGRHKQTEYKSQYTFEERWEKDYRYRNQDRFFSWLKQSSILYFLINLVILLVRVSTLWYTSVRRVFQFTNIDFIYIILIGTIILDEIVCCIHLQNNKSGDQSKKFLYEESIMNILSLILTILTYTRSLDANEQMILFDAIFLYLEYKRCTKIYRYYRRILISQSFKNQLNIFDMLLTLIAIGHLFAIALYLTAELNPTENWTTRIINNLHQWDDRYAYSMYFAFTTMLTVGYGDLAPTNKFQILVVLLVQILGVVTFAYVINEIGGTLSEIKKQQQSLDHNIGMIERLSKYYQLGKDLTIRARDFIVGNQLAHQQFNIQDQNKLLNQLNEELREQITNQTNTKLMCRSIFFLCHWSKTFRAEIAKKLIKKIFLPNEKLSCHSSSKQNIFIVHKGVLKVFTQRFHRGKQCLKKHVKTIVSSPKQQILNNVYGYTSSLTQKHVLLSAIAEEFMVAYVLEKKSFIDVIKQWTADFQYYHELKSKLEQLKCTQSLQVPEIVNIRQHYCPSIQYLLYKLRRKNRTQNRKKDYIRGQRKFHLIVNPQILEEEFATNFQSQPQVLNDLLNFVPMFIDEFELEREYPNFFRKSNLSYTICEMESKNYNIAKRKNRRNID